MIIVSGVYGAIIIRDKYAKIKNDI